MVAFFAGPFWLIYGLLEDIVAFFAEAILVQFWATLRHSGLLCGAILVHFGATLRHSVLLCGGHFGSVLGYCKT